MIDSCEWSRVNMNVMYVCYVLPFQIGLHAIWLITCLIKVEQAVTQKAGEVRRKCHGCMQAFSVSPLHKAVAHINPCLLAHSLISPFMSCSHVYPLHQLEPLPIDACPVLRNDDSFS